MQLTSVNRTQQALNKLDPTAISKHGVMLDDATIRFKVEATTCTGLTRIVTMILTPEGYRMGVDDKRFIEVCKAQVVNAELTGSPVSPALISQLLSSAPIVRTKEKNPQLKPQISEQRPAPIETPSLVLNPFNSMFVPQISETHPIRSTEFWNLLNARYPGGVAIFDLIPGYKHVTLDPSKKSIIVVADSITVSIPCTTLSSNGTPKTFLDAGDAKLIAFKALLDEDGPLALDAIKLLFSRARNHTATDFDAAAFIIAKMVFYTGSTDHKSEWRDYFQSLFRGSATRYSEALLSRGLPSRYEYKNTVTGELSGGYDLTGVSTL